MIKVMNIITYVKLIQVNFRRNLCLYILRPET